MTLGRPACTETTSPTSTDPRAWRLRPTATSGVADGHRGGNNRLVRFTSDGAFVRSVGGGVGSESREPARFSDPHDVKVDSRGRVYVADRGNSRVQVFDDEGEVLYLWTHYGKPSGLFIDRNDMLYAGDGLSGDLRTGPPDPWRSNFGWEKGIRIGDLNDEQAWVRHFIPQHDENVGPGIEFLGVDLRREHLRGRDQSHAAGEVRAGAAAGDRVGEVTVWMPGRKPSRVRRLEGPGRTPRQLQ